MSRASTSTLSGTDLLLVYKNYTKHEGCLKARGSSRFLSQSRASPAHHYARDCHLYAARSIRSAVCGFSLETIISHVGYFNEASLRALLVVLNLLWWQSEQMGLRSNSGSWRGGVDDNDGDVKPSVNGAGGKQVRATP